MKNKENRFENQIVEEEIYRRQLIKNHSVLGKDLIPKYDTGEKIE